jgi:predicted phage-related endonuclease
MPDNETINRHIAEKVMGIPCWHDFQNDCICQKPDCYKDNSYWNRNPEYTSDDSPRRLLNEAVDKAVEMVGSEHILETLLERCDGIDREVRLLNASAQQIATAIYHATKEEGK